MVTIVSIYRQLFGVINTTFRIVITSWEEGKNVTREGYTKASTDLAIYFLNWGAGTWLLVILYPICCAFLKYLVNQWDVEASPLITVRLHGQGRRSPGFSLCVMLAGLWCVCVAQIWPLGAPGESQYLALQAGTTFYSWVSKGEQ